MERADLGDVFAELHRARALHHDPEVVQIRISPNAIPGSIAILPIFGEEAERFHQKGIRQPREVSIHTEDWKSIKQSLPRVTGGTWSGDGVVNSLIGIPIIEP